VSWDASCITNFACQGFLESKSLLATEASLFSGLANIVVIDAPPEPNYMQRQQQAPGDNGLLWEVLVLPPYSCCTAGAAALSIVFTWGQDERPADLQQDCILCVWS
jgi:hypothetical protein